ncbi:MAG: hypothetical protein ACRDY0_02370 [Acidimicrobiales bacterium]
MGLVVALVAVMATGGTAQAGPPRDGIAPHPPAVTLPAGPPASAVRAAGYANAGVLAYGDAPFSGPDGAIDTLEGDSGPGPVGAYGVTINGPFLPSDSPDYNGAGIFAYAVP